MPARKSPERDYAAPPEGSLENQLPDQDVAPSQPTDTESTASVAEMPAYSPGGLQAPSRYKDALTLEGGGRVDKMVDDQAFTKEMARKRELKSNYIPSSPPEIPSGHRAHPTELPDEEERLTGAPQARAMFEKIPSHKPDPQPTEFP